MLVGDTFGNCLFICYQLAQLINFIFRSIYFFKRFIVVESFCKNSVDFVLQTHFQKKLRSLYFFSSVQIGGKNKTEIISFVEEHRAIEKYRAPCNYDLMNDVREGILNQVMEMCRWKLEKIILFQGNNTCKLLFQSYHLYLSLAWRKSSSSSSSSSSLFSTTRSSSIRFVCSTSLIK